LRIRLLSPTLSRRARRFPPNLIDWSNGGAIIFSRRRGPEPSQRIFFYALRSSSLLNLHFTLVIVVRPHQVLGDFLLEPGRLLPFSFTVRPQRGAFNFFFKPIGRPPVFFCSPFLFLEPARKICRLIGRPVRSQTRATVS